MGKERLMPGGKRGKNQQKFLNNFSMEDKKEEESGNSFKSKRMLVRSLKKREVKKAFY